MISLKASWRRLRGGRFVALSFGACAVCLSLSLPAAAQSYRDGPHPLTRAEATQVEVLVGTLHEVAQSGRVRLAYRQDVLPFSFVPEDWHRPVGYSISICRAVVEAMSRRLDKPLEVEWVPVTASDRFDVIEQGKADLECGVTSDTPERRSKVSFSAPIFITGARVLVRRDSGIKALADVAGQRIGVVSTTTSQEALTEWLGKQDIRVELVSFDGYAAGYEALAHGKVDALLGDEVLLYGQLAREGGRRDYLFVGPWVTYEVYGIAFRHDDEDVKTMVNRTLSRLAANGELENLYSRWFQRRLPGGYNLSLPMSPTMRTAILLLARGVSTK